MLMKSANPVLTRGFQEISYEEISLGRQASSVMTLQGTIVKSAVLFFLTVIAGGVSWSIVAANPALGFTLWGGGGLLAFLAIVIVCFWRQGAMVLGPTYAIAKGLCLGGFTYVIAHQLAGAGKASTAGLFAAQALVLTCAIFAGLLVAFSFKLVRLGSTATKMVWTLTWGVAIFGLIMFVLYIFNVGRDFTTAIFSPFSGSLLGIGFSLFVVILASFRLVTNFQYIEEGIESGQPKYMEWYGALGLLVALVWLYVEIVVLLSKLRNR